MGEYLQSLAAGKHKLGACVIIIHIDTDVFLKEQGGNAEKHPSRAGCFVLSFTLTHNLAVLPPSQTTTTVISSQGSGILFHHFCKEQPVFSHISHSGIIFVSHDYTSF